MTEFSKALGPIASDAVATAALTASGLDEARDALEPFARIAPHVEHTDLRDGDIVHRQSMIEDGKLVGWMELTKQDFRRARTVADKLRGE